MTNQQHLALADLARTVGECIRTLGPVCTANLLGNLAVDLFEAEATTEPSSGAGESPTRPRMDPSTRPAAHRSRPRS